MRKRNLKRAKKGTLRNQNLETLMTYQASSKLKKTMKMKKRKMETKKKKTSKRKSSKRKQRRMKATEKKKMKETTITT